MPTTKLEEKDVKKDVKLTNEQIAEAATNNPIFVKEEVELGDPPQTFKIHYLEYDDQITFMTLLEPVFADILSRIGAVDTNKKLDFRAMIALCKDSLPEMGRIVLKQTKPDITIDEVKKLCGGPFKICELVLLQAKKNKFIDEFSRFFPQLASLMTM